MRIIPLNSATLLHNNVSKKSVEQSKSNNDCTSASFSDSSMKFLSQVTFKGMPLAINSLKEIKDKTDNLSPKAIEYRKNLLINDGKNPENYYKLFSVISADEIKSIMNTFDDNPDVFSVGKEDINIKNADLRANLHIHTINSDGALTVQELLDKATEYANKVAAKNPAKANHAPFTIAITDHDAVEGCKEAFNIILQNPLKYKNLRVIFGTEITTFNNIATDIMKKPTDTHILLYGIDPNNKIFSGYIEEVKAKKHKIAEKMINKSNKIFAESFGENYFFSLKEAGNLYSILKKGLTGIYKQVITYAKIKTIIKNIILKDSKLLELIKQKNIPATSEGLLDELQKYYYSINLNRKTRSPVVTLAPFLSDKLDLSQAEATKIIETGINKESYKQFDDKLEAGLEEYKRTLAPKHDYMPTMSDLYKALKSEEDIMFGLAHPLEYLSNLTKTEDKIKFLSELYEKFYEICKDKAVFSEAYYQSYSYKDIDSNEIDFLNKHINNFSKMFNLFKTGSADTHGLNIFKRV